jgi:hypothetical protein
MSLKQLVRQPQFPITPAYIFTDYRSEGAIVMDPETDKQLSIDTITSAM